MKKIEFTFIFCGETKNNYIFEQPDSEEKPKMFPRKIYLNKSLFGKQPQQVTVEIVP